MLNVRDIKDVGDVRDLGSLARACGRQVCGEGIVCSAKILSCQRNSKYLLRRYMQRLHTV